MFESDKSIVIMEVAPTNKKGCEWIVDDELPEIIECCVLVKHALPISS